MALPIDVVVQDERGFHGAYGMPPHEYGEMLFLLVGLEDGSCHAARQAADPDEESAAVQQWRGRHNRNRR